MIEKNSKKVHIGLDLGIASVGWSIVDSEQNIIATGSHLFSQLSDPKTFKYNEGERGEIRRTRRSINRRKQRKLDFLNMIDQFNDNSILKIQETGKVSKFWKEEYQKMFGFTKDNSSSDFLFNEAKKYDVYKIWKEGFERELSRKELFLFLYFKLGFRGVFFKEFSWEEKKKYTYEDSLLKNVFEKQYFLNNRKFRNKSNADNSFSIKWNWKDIECILNNCSYVSKEFIEDYKKIFLRLRDFSKGPGSYSLKDKQSKWGIQFEQGENANLWDGKIGYCPISLTNNKGDFEKAEKKLNRYFCLPELSNIISQLVYVTYGKNESDSKPLSKEQILLVINNSLNKKENITKNRIEKLLFNNQLQIFKYPKTKDKEDSNFEKMEKLRFMINNLLIKKENFKIEEIYETIWNIDQNRFSLITKNFIKSDDKKNESKQNKNFDETKIELKNKLKDINLIGNKLNYDELANFKDIDEKTISGSWEYGRASFDKYLQYFFDRDESEKSDSFAVYYRNEIKQGQKYLFSFNNESKYLPENMFKKQDFISPNAKNTLKESVRVLNRLLKQFIYKNKYYLESIIIETTWNDNDIKNSINFSLNSEQKKKELIQYQNWRESQRKLAEKWLKEENISISNENIRKYLLWMEQDKKDPYSNRSILPNEIINCQIDHIVPENISFNSNWENLVLTKENSSKGNSLAFEFISQKNNKDEILEFWKSIYDVANEKTKDISLLIKAKKYKNLMTTKETLVNNNFINSNLSETTYAIRKLKDGLTFYLENFNEKYKNKSNPEYELIKDCDIRTINGWHSQTLRRKFFNLEEKDREVANHHSHDATMIAMFSSLDYVNNFYKKIKEIGTRTYVLKNIYSDYKNYGIPIYYLNRIISNSYELGERIKASKCLYSFKKVTILPKNFAKEFEKRKNNHEQLFELFRSIKPKKLFSNQNIESYCEIEKSGILEKHKIVYQELNTNDLSNTTIQTFYKSLIFLFLKIKKEFIEKDVNESNYKKIREIIERAKNEESELWIKVLTEWKIIYDLYLCVCDDLDKLEELLKNKDGDKKEKMIFKNYIEKLKSDNLLNNLKENVNGKLYEVNDQYIDNLLLKYIPIIDWKNNTFIKVSKIKYISKANFNVTKNLIDKKLNNKNIFNTSKTKTFYKNSTLYGNETKLFLLLDYLDEKTKKRKLDYFKLNQQNQIVHCPKEYKIIKYLDPLKWYLINDEIYKISNFNITNNCVYVLSISNKKSIKEIIKSYSSWSKFKDDENQKKIFEIIIK